MEDVEVVLTALFISVVVLAAAARAINVPYPIVLVIGGAILGLLPGLPDVQLDPDLVLVLCSRASRWSTTRRRSWPIGSRSRRRPVRRSRCWTRAGSSSVLSAYAAYVPAEHLDVSAVLAAVTVGCYGGWQAPWIASPATRIQGFGMWELLQFLLTATLFVLIGLQLPVVLDGLEGTSWTTLLGYAAAVSAAVVLTRLVWQQTVVFLIRAVDRRESVRARRSTWQLEVG